MTDKDNELIENVKFLANCCKNEYNDIRIDAVLLGSLDLINRKQAEIERLKTDNALLRQDINADNAEIRALRRKLEISKSEAVKEFENIVTDLCYKEFGTELEMAHTFVAIINKAKEMVTEEDK